MLALIWRATPPLRSLGRRGRITLGPNLCCPSQLQFIPNQGEPESVELPLSGHRMQFEVLRVQECLAQGLLECPEFHLGGKPENLRRDRPASQGWGNPLRLRPVTGGHPVKAEAERAPALERRCPFSSFQDSPKGQGKHKFFCLAQSRAIAAKRVPSSAGKPRYAISVLMEAKPLGPLFAELADHQSHGKNSGGEADLNSHGNETGLRAWLSKRTRPEMASTAWLYQ